MLNMLNRDKAVSTIERALGLAQDDLASGNHSSTIEVEPFMPGSSQIPAAEEVISADRGVVYVAANPVSGSKTNAFYAPRYNSIVLPSHDFATFGGYYTLAFHELGHWAGNMLSRPAFNPFYVTTPMLVIEEATAQLTSFILCDHFGVDNTPFSESYIRAYFRGAFIHLNVRPEDVKIDSIVGDALERARYVLEYRARTDTNVYRKEERIEYTKRMVVKEFGAGNFAWALAVEVPLNNGGFVIVDDEDAEIARQSGWYAAYNGHSKWYVRRTKSDGTPVYLHRVIMGVYSSRHMVDHINGDTFDCRKENLRKCRARQNAWNRVKVAGTSSRFKGVSRVADDQWRARIQDHSLGTFRTEEEAARAYDKEATKRFGAFALLNFPKEKTA